MHDSQIEDQLRGALRAEGDGIPLTITTAELERRLAARQRASGGRRLSFVAAAVAAVVVVSMVAAGNGWLKLPAIGTVPSPSASGVPTPEPSAVPSFEPVPGVGRIEPLDGSTVLTEVLPTRFAGAQDGAFDADLPLDQYVVTVSARCVGTSLTVTEGSRSWPIRCDPDPAPEPMLFVTDIPLVDGHLALRWVVEAGVGYTILVTTSVLPASLPALDPLDGTVLIDASSPSDRPIASGSGTRVTQSLGSVPDAEDYALSIVCLGPGDLAYSLGQPGRSDFAMSSSLVCNGQTESEGFTHPGDAGGQHEVFITADSRTAWHVMVSVVIPGTGPSTISGPPARSPLGRPDEAILVRPIGDRWTTPDLLEVTRFDPADQSSELIATIPGSVVPAGKWISPDAKPVVSATGWLAIPIRPGPEATDREPAIVFVDLLDPETQPRSIVGPSSGSWNGDTFAAIGEGGVQIYDPATGFLGVAPVNDPAVYIATAKDDAFEPIWTTAPNGRFVARSESGQWGVISVDGSFSPTTDLPPVYQRTGLERPVGIEAHRLRMACTGSGNVIEAGCTLAENDATGTPIATRIGKPDFAYLADHVWAADGRKAWLLFGSGTDRGRGGDGVASLTLSDSSGNRQELARIGPPAGEDPRILGVGADDPAGHTGFIVIGDNAGFVAEFVAFAGGTVGVESRTAWFAGWAGNQPDYDPD